LNTTEQMRRSKSVYFASLGGYSIRFEPLCRERETARPT
jgi:hypothetical protein